MRESRLFRRDDRIGDYRVIRFIDAGGLGEVYLCKKNFRITRYAIKVPKRDNGDHARFVREAKVTGTLEHPHIVKVYESEIDKTPHFISMEFLKGTSLQKLPAASIEPACCYNLIRQFLDAAKYVHDQGYIHRDLTPKNVMILKHDSNHPVIKLIDFGLVKPLNTKGTTLTKTGAILGTPGYMAPEQEYGLPVDHRSDIVNCGRIIEKILHLRKFDDVHEKPIPDPFENIKSKCFEEEPDNRYQTIDELITSVENAIQNSTPKNKDRFSFKYAASAAVVALLVVAFLLFVFGNNEQSVVDESIAIPSNISIPISPNQTEKTNSSTAQQLKKCEKALMLTSHDSEAILIEKLAILAQCYRHPKIDSKNISNVIVNLINNMASKNQGGSGGGNRTTIQVALDTLGQRPSSEHDLVFKNVNLSGYTLRGDFTNATFLESTLQKSNFRNALLHKVHVSDTDMKGATFNGSRLDEISGNFDCKKCKFLSRTTMLNANLEFFNAQYATFTDGFDAAGSVIKKARFQYAQMISVSFRGAVLSQANFDKAQQLENVDMRDADLSWARFCNANLCNLDIGGANVLGAEINCAKKNTGMISRNVKGKWR